MKLGVKIKGAADMRACIASLEPGRARSIWEHYLHAAHTRVGQAGVAAIRNSIKADEYAANSPITVIIKGSSKPLVDRGDLFQAISYEIRGHWMRIGLFRQIAGVKTYNLGLLLHEGFSYTPTDRQRAAVWAKVAEALGSSRTGSSRQATRGAALAMGSRAGSAAPVWVVPARPFIRKPLSSSSFLSGAQRTYEQAAAAAIAQIGRGR